AAYIVRRLLTSILLMIGVTIVTFALTTLVPGDPITAALGEGAASNQATVDAYVERHGLDKPVPQRYLIYMTHLLQGALGTSIHTGRPVLDDLGAVIPATVEVALAAIILSLAVSLVLGTLAAYRRGKVTDQVVRVVSLIGLSLPMFWLAIVTYLVFFLHLGIAPGSGRLSPQLSPPSGARSPPPSCPSATSPSPPAPAGFPRSSPRRRDARGCTRSISFSTAIRSGSSTPQLTSRCRCSCSRCSRSGSSPGSSAPRC